jgi:hypothetical protein
MKSKSKKKVSQNNEVTEDEYTKMINIYVDALLYEPTNTVPADFAEEEYNLPLIYIHHPPTKTLHHYLHDFCPTNGSMAMEDCLMCNNLPKCFGCGFGSHTFLKAEGIFECSKCQKILCTECFFNQNEIDNNHFCYDCYLPELSVSKSQIEDDLTLSEVRERLSELGVETTSTDVYVDLLDIYDAKKNCRTFNEETMSKIKTPTESPNYLPILQDSTLSSFTFAKGGSLL